MKQRSSALFWFNGAGGDAVDDVVASDVIVPWLGTMCMVSTSATQVRRQPNVQDTTKTSVHVITSSRVVSPFLSSLASTMSVGCGYEGVDGVIRGYHITTTLDIPMKVGQSFVAQSSDHLTHPGECWPIFECHTPSLMHIPSDHQLINVNRRSHNDVWPINMFSLTSRHPFPFTLCVRAAHLSPLGTAPGF